MLLRKLEPARRPDRRHRDRRRHTSALPALHLVVDRSWQVDPHAAYPCTRMHGAAFESEFYGEPSEPGILGA